MHSLLLPFSQVHLPVSVPVYLSSILRSSSVPAASLLLLSTEPVMSGMLAVLAEQTEPALSVRLALLLLLNSRPAEGMGSCSGAGELQKPGPAQEPDDMRLEVGLAKLSAASFCCWAVGVDGLLPRVLLLGALQHQSRVNKHVSTDTEAGHRPERICTCNLPQLAAVCINSQVGHPL